jgi:hypothetical protein
MSLPHCVPLGRPTIRSPRDKRNAVLAVLDKLGPATCLPTLRDCFPSMPRAEIEDIVRRYRRVWLGPTGNNGCVRSSACTCDLSSTLWTIARSGGSRYKPLDRLSRRLEDCITTLADWSERNLRVVVVTQQFDFNGSMGRMIAALLLGLAEIENEYRKERQAAGIEQAKKKGIYKGRANGTLKGNPARVVVLRDKGLTARSSVQRWAFRCGRSGGIWAGTTTSR